MPNKLNQKQIDKIQKLSSDWKTNKEIADILGIWKTSVYKYINDLDIKEQEKEKNKEKQQVVSSTKRELDEWIKQDSYMLDLDKKNVKNELSILKKKYDKLLSDIEDKDKMYKTWGELQNNNNNSIKIEKDKSKSETESTAVLVASDWHIEEIVNPETVNYLNEYNPDIAKQRAIKFWQNWLKMVDMLANEEKINNVVIALLGDFISWYIHPELMEENPMSPTEAILYVKSLITWWIDMFLKNSNYDMTIVTAFGNHWRIWEKKKISTWRKNSYEWMMYNLIAQQYENEDRIKFKIEKWYHNYLNVYDNVLRFHHWDNIKYQWWVGGITIPMNKAIAQWNKAKKADYDVAWHWHQMKDWGIWLTNGSLIWYWPYAESIKADYEDPKQLMFLINNKYGKTITAPIVLT